MVNRFVLSRTGAIGAVMLVLIILTALCAPLLSPYTHRTPSGPSLAPPDREHPLGTDDLGIDVWAQIVHGARVSLAVGSGSAVLVGLLASSLGILAAYRGGWVDTLIVGVSDTLMIIPHLPMMIVFGAFFGPSLRNIIMIITLLSWAGPARTIRAAVLSAGGQNYIRAARGYGAGFFHQAVRHFLPAVVPILAAGMIRVMGRAVVMEASMAFLGLGDPLSKSWGVIINRSITFPGIYFTEYWTWWVVPPVVALILTVLSISLLGRELERWSGAGRRWR